MSDRQANGAVTFTYDTRQLQAQPGTSVAGALHAADVRVITRSMKYRRPRGVYCAGGYCPNCLVRIDGTGFKRACVTPVEQGMVVESQMSTGPGGFDPMRIIDYFGFLFPLGFQYRLFKRQGRLYNAWEANLRRIAGHARMPDRAPTVGRVRRVTADLCVIGAGPAGIGAASAAAASGLKVAVVAAWWGGRSAELIEQRFRLHPDEVRRAASELPSRVAELFSPARAIGWFDGVTIVDAAGELVEISSPRSVLATGAYERPLIFDGNDLPGVMLSSAAVKLAYRDGVSPGTCAVVATGTDEGHRAAVALHQSRVEVATVLDVRSSPPEEVLRSTRQVGITVATGARVVRARGSRVVRELVFTVGGSEQRLACDLVAMSGGWQAADELRYQATSRGQSVIEGDGIRPARLGDPRADVDAILQAVGAAVGTHTPLAAFQEGYVVGLHAARATGVTVDSELEAAAATIVSRRP